MPSATLQSESSNTVEQQQVVAACWQTCARKLAAKNVTDVETIFYPNSKNSQLFLVCLRIYMPNDMNSTAQVHTVFQRQQHIVNQLPPLREYITCLACRCDCDWMVDNSAVEHAQQMCNDLTSRWHTSACTERCTHGNDMSSSNLICGNLERCGLASLDHNPDMCHSQCHKLVYKHSASQAWNL